ncbi:MAG: hypothetical protein ACFFFH_09220 [Candidatus Thorarchaeota archaeon]
MISQLGIELVNISLLVPDAIVLSILGLAITQAILIKFIEPENRMNFAVLMTIIGLIINYIIVFVYFLLDDLTVFVFGSFWNFFSYLTIAHTNGVIFISGVMILIFAPALAYSKRI